MRNPLPAARRHMLREARRLRRQIGRLRRREGTLSFHVEQGGLQAAVARALASALQCTLSDHLLQAAETLERAAEDETPLLVEPAEREGVLP